MKSSKQNERWYVQAVWILSRKYSVPETWNGKMIISFSDMNSNPQRNSVSIKKIDWANVYAIMLVENVFIQFMVWMRLPEIVKFAIFAENIHLADSNWIYWNFSLFHSCTFFPVIKIALNFVDWWHPRSGDASTSNQPHGDNLKLLWSVIWKNKKCNQNVTT